MKAFLNAHTVREIQTNTLNISFIEAGPPDGRVVILLHGFPYDVHSYQHALHLLAERGYRVIVPCLRGHGFTTYRFEDTKRSGQQALGADVVDLMDALGVERAILAGFDWGGRAACVVSALWPERVSGLVSVNGYLIQDLETSQRPLDPRRESGFWYFVYFLTQRGYAGLSEKLATRPAIAVPTVTLDGLADGNFPATDGSAASLFFTGPHLHVQVPHAGHNLPQEAPEPFAKAIDDVARLGS